MRKIIILFLSLISIAAASRAQDAPVLERIAGELDNYPGRGEVWQLTRGNELPSGWVIPTDNRVDGAVLAKAIGDMVSRAEKTVDISVLAPLPNGVFFDELKRGLASLAASGRAVTVRILAGNPNFVTPENTSKYVETLIPTLEGSQITLFVGAMTTCNPPGCAGAFGAVSSFNHAKIVAIDGKEAIVGGHNLWSDYSGPGPIYDLSMHVRGPAARAAASFTAAMWKHTCTAARPGLPLWLTYSNGRVPTSKTSQNVCSMFDTEPIPTGTGGIPILAIGRTGIAIGNLGNFKPQWQWSDLAMQRVLESARSTIRISQQDLMTTTGAVNTPMLDAIANLIAREQAGDVYIIVTNFGAHASSILAPYSWLVTPKQLGADIKNRVATQMKLPVTDPAVKERVCSKLHLGGIARFEASGPTNMWSPTRPMGNHAKFYMIDDRVFYIGSHNMYPITATSVDPREWWRVLQGSLQEYGYIVEDANAAKQVLETYWNPIWAPTSELAVSGGARPCEL